MPAAWGAAQRNHLYLGGSEADNQALWTAALKGKAQGKCHLIASSVEHHAVLHTLKVLEENGFTVTLLPVDANCQVSPEAVQEALRPDTCLVSVMAANNETGALQPIQAIGRLCQKAGVPFHTDAVQLVGICPFRSRPAVPPCCPFPPTSSMDPRA